MWPGRTQPMPIPHERNRKKYGSQDRSNKPFLKVFERRKKKRGGGGDKRKERRKKEENSPVLANTEFPLGRSVPKPSDHVLLGFFNLKIQIFSLAGLPLARLFLANILNWVKTFAHD